MIESTTDTIRVEEIGGENANAVQVRLNRPEKLNSLTPEQGTALIEIFESITVDDADALVITGTGGDFCTGADVSKFDLDGDGDGGFEIGFMHELIDSLRECPIPVISRVHGRAFGAGFMFCMASDVVVAASDAQFGLQEVKIGLPVEGYTTTLLTRIVGEHRAREWLLTGDLISAERARDAGFASRMVPEARLDETVESYLSTFSENSAATMATLKSRMADPTPMQTSAEVRAMERDALAAALASEDVRERIRALLNS